MDNNKIKARFGVGARHSCSACVLYLAVQATQQNSTLVEENACDRVTMAAGNSISAEIHAIAKID
jgi:hypothetical protein